VLMLLCSGGPGRASCGDRHDSLREGGAGRASYTFCRRTGEGEWVDRYGGGGLEPLRCRLDRVGLSYSEGGDGYARLDV